MASVMLYHAIRQCGLLCPVGYTTREDSNTSGILDIAGDSRFAEERFAEELFAEERFAEEDRLERDGRRRRVEDSGLDTERVTEGLVLRVFDRRFDSGFDNGFDRRFDNGFDSGFDSGFDRGVVRRFLVRRFFEKIFSDSKEESGFCVACLASSSRLTLFAGIICFFIIFSSSRSNP